eukprot:1059497-Rhodomonas_salina.2
MSGTRIAMPGTGFTSATFASGACCAVRCPVTRCSGGALAGHRPVADCLTVSHCLTACLSHCLTLSTLSLSHSLTLSLSHSLTLSLSDCLSVGVSCGAAAGSDAEAERAGAAAAARAHGP